MDAADLYPEILRPYDPRNTPRPPPTQGICDPGGYCIYVEQHWWSHINGMIARLLYRDAWEGTDDEIQDAIDSISKILNVGALTMGCGCGGSSLPFPTRIGENGQVQVSYDGGATWQDAPQYDPRTNVTQLPPVTAGEGEDAKCKAANSAVAYFQQIEEDAHAKRVAGATVAEIAEAIISFLVLVGIIATGGALAILGGALAAIAASQSAADFDAAFTSGVWADLLCRIYCALGDDGTMTDAKFSALIGQVKTDHAGIAGDFLSGTIQMVGKNGLINASRLGLNAGLACDSCPDCDTTPQVWISDLVTPAVRIFPDEDGVFTAVQSGTATGDGFYWIVVQFAEVLDTSGWTPCNNIGILTGGVSFHEELRCHDGVGDPLGSCRAAFTNRNTAPWTMTFTIAYPDEPCT